MARGAGGGGGCCRPRALRPLVPAGALADAVKAFGARTAWRGWSHTDPSVHWAYYAFDSVQAVEAVQTGSAIKALIAEFDRWWGAKLTRTREVIAVADEMIV